MIVKCLTGWPWLWTVKFTIMPCKYFLMFSIHCNINLWVGYSSDDINKFLWMIRIGGSTPEGAHIKEKDYYTNTGEYKVWLALENDLSWFEHFLIDLTIFADIYWTVCFTCFCSGWQRCSKGNERVSHVQDVLLQVSRLWVYFSFL